MRKRMFKAMLSLSCVGGLLLAPQSASAIVDLGAWFALPDSSPTAQLAYLNGIVLPLYNLFHDPNLPTATYGTDNIGVEGGLTSITLPVNDYDYLKLKWGGMWQYYYIGDETGDYTFNSTGFNLRCSPRELSHYTFFSPRDVPGVPDGGLTVGLLGLGLVGVGLLQKRI